MENKNDFKIIALRATSEKSAGIKKLVPNHYYYFYEGYRILENRIEINESVVASIPTDLFSSKLPLRKNNTKLSVNISAIVGENGSGKSSIIEFAIRLINNLSAAYIGEYYVNPRAEHLHYIENLYGELYYVIGKTYYCLSIEGRTVSIFTYNENLEKNKNSIFPITSKNKSNVFESLMNSRLNIDLFNLNSFFYTFISNYSMYSYNTYDLINECTPVNIEEHIRKRINSRTKVDERDYDDRCWIKGIFHKNDGYQTPIVLTPFRDEGNININRENHLAKERLLTLMLMTDDSGRYSFKTINSHLEAEKWFIPITIDKKYDRTFVAKNLKFRYISFKCYDALVELIKEYWGDCLGINLNNNKKKQYYKLAINYLAYKTLKISRTYKLYEAFALKLEKIRSETKIDKELLKELINNLSGDSSHITQKIRQILAYLIFDIYDDVTTESILIEDISLKANNAIKNNNYKNSCFDWKLQDMVPPPIFETEIVLYDKISKRHNISFDSLSSGERQIAYSISSFLYHMSNIDSVKNDINSTTNKRVFYKHVYAIFEEVELYFHPDLQRRFIKYLLDGLKQINLQNLDSINICIVTHSPFVLSDIPSNNILFLNKEGKSVKTENNTRFDTFGANIHDLLQYSFFLEEGSMGEFARETINELISILNFLKEFHSGIKESSHVDKLEFTEYFKLNYTELYKSVLSNEKIDTNKVKLTFNQNDIAQKIRIIDEPIIRKALFELFYEIFDNDYKEEEEIFELERRLSILKNKRNK